MDKSTVAALLVLPCILAAAFAMVPSEDRQAPGVDPQAPGDIPVAPDPSKATVCGSIDFSPSVLNLNSAGRYVTVRLTLPDGYSVSSVYIPSLRFMGTVYAETCFSDHETGADKENSPHMMIKFLREDVSAVLDPGAMEQVFLTGMLVDGSPLYATGMVSVTA